MKRRGRRQGKQSIKTKLLLLPMQMHKSVTLPSASAAAAAAGVQTDLTSAKAVDLAGLAYDGKSGEELARPHHAGVLEQTSAAARGACKEICNSSCTDNYTDTEHKQSMGMKMLVCITVCNPK